MARAKHICAKPDCPKPSAGSYCATHQAETEAKRGTASQRGYGSQHQRQRTSWISDVEAGRITCHRCGNRIQPGQPWDLGHDDNDRTKYAGPEHAHCNRSEGGKRGRLYQSNG